MGYSQYQSVIPPGHLKRTYGVAWNAALGLCKDYLADVIKQGVQQRSPLVAQSDALALIGAERGIIQGPSENTATYVQALVNAWAAWELAGTAWGLLAQLNNQGYSPYIACANGYIYGPGATLSTPPTLVQSGVPYRWSGYPDSFWSVFGLIFDPLPASWTDIVNPATPTSSPSRNEIQFICSIVETWKPAFATFAGILAVQSYPLWGWPRAGIHAAIWGASGRNWGGGSSSFFTPI
jgi:hypothetical protein